MIPPKVRFINFSLSAEIQADETIPLSSNFELKFKGCQDSKRLTNILLTKNTQGHFILEVVGANGERIQGKTLQMRFHFDSFNNKDLVTLITDDKG